MQPTLRSGSLMLLLALAPACGGGSGESPGTPSSPAPTPVPTPEPLGTIELLSATLPADSTVTVDPMFEIGQQAQQLRFTVRITLDESRAGVLVQAWVRTETERCMGGGFAGLDFEGGVSGVVSPGSMSSTAGNCTLPYTTTEVEVGVVDSTGPIVEQRFPVTYHFVAAS